MKKVLFASTALVAFASAAAAEVTLSGSAEMGIFDTSQDGVDAQFHTDIDVTFTMSGETDGGLVFGASIDLDESDGSNVGEDTAPTVAGPGPDGVLGTDDDEVEFVVPGSFGASPAFTGNTQGGETIFLSGGFGTITMGDTDGALDWAVTEVLFNSGSLTDNEEHAGYFDGSGLDEMGDGQILRYDYSFGDFGVALSAEQQNDSTDDAILGIGFKYGLDFGGTVIDLGLGYQATEDSIDLDLDGDDDTTENVDVLALSANASFGAVTAGLIYADFDMGDNDMEHIGIGAGYSAGALALHANYGKYDIDNADDVEGFGVTAGYDLGGGAVVQFGYGNNDTGADDFDTYSFGVAMSF